MAPPPLGISRIALGHSVPLGSDDPSKLAALDDAAAWLVYPSRSYVPQKRDVAALNTDLRCRKCGTPPARHVAPHVCCCLTNLDTDHIAVDEDA